MSKLRNNLESYVVRRTGEILDELSEDRREELAQLLHELEGHSSRAAEAEARVDELIERLEERKIELAAADTEIQDLRRRLHAAQGELGDRETELTELLETERVKNAERDRQLRAKIDELERDTARRAHELAATEADLRRREEALATREAELKAYVARVQGSLRH